MLSSRWKASRDTYELQQPDRAQNSLGGPLVVAARNPVEHAAQQKLVDLARAIVKRLADAQGSPRSPGTRGTPIATH